VSLIDAEGVLLVLGIGPVWCRKAGGVAGTQQGLEVQSDKVWVW
jgi:hypothetical protein